MSNLSPLATQVAGARSPTNKPNVRGVPFGILFHTTGGGVTDVARKRKESPLAVALRVYIGSQNGDNGYPWGGPHYVMTHDGSLHQIAPDNLRTEHAGSANRWRYRDGSWEHVYPKTTAAWKKQWPQFAHPYSGFPSTSPNHDYIGVEMIPCGDGFGVPMRKGLRFTQAQHDSAIRLAHDAAARHGWPAGWSQGYRLVGHEDVDPLSRSWDSGAWDPGYLRPDPFFDFAYVRGAVEAP